MAVLGSLFSKIISGLVVSAISSGAITGAVIATSKGFEQNVESQNLQDINSKDSFSPKIIGEESSQNEGSQAQKLDLMDKQKTEIEGSGFESTQMDSENETTKVKTTSELKQEKSTSYKEKPSAESENYASEDLGIPDNLENQQVEISEEEKQRKEVEELERKKKELEELKKKYRKEREEKQISLEVVLINRDGGFKNSPDKHCLLYKDNDLLEKDIDVSNATDSDESSKYCDSGTAVTEWAENKEINNEENEEGLWVRGKNESIVKFFLNLIEILS
ncbi:hypothetical protein [Mycoplasma suis]|uniref:Uncharacterized protein n=1 Tax=Mycoplasma suis (strain Illinois) TaxID=768700 RepID=F0QQ26_MYCSL|nr:hypothetical protein [Mycoplasma suis]ADX97596.1 hypothetical protein MSU_0052 [Mycoplasma suis str. Illinois]